MTINNESERDFLIRFAEVHVDFRKDELLSVAQLLGIPVIFPFGYSSQRPFSVVRLRSCSAAKALAERCILIHDITELWAMSSTVNSLHSKLKESHYPALHRECSFKFKVEAFGLSLSSKEQIERINSLSFLNFKGKIDLKSPEEKFVYFEDYCDVTKSIENNLQNALNLKQNQNEKIIVTVDEYQKELHQVYMGRFISKGARNLIKKYAKKNEPFHFVSFQALGGGNVRSLFKKSFLIHIIKINNII